MIIKQKYIIIIFLISIFVSFMYVIGSFSFQLTLLKPILSDNYVHLKRQGAIDFEPITLWQHSLPSQP